MTRFLISEGDLTPFGTALSGLAAFALLLIKIGTLT